MKDSIKRLIVRPFIIIPTWPPLYLLLLIGWATGALVVVPLALAFGVDMTKLPIWGNPKGLDWWPTATNRAWFKRNSYWWYAFRNPMAKVHELFTQPEKVTIYGDPGNLEDKEGIQWQYNFSGWMDELRITFGKPNIKDGKNELLLGWKRGDQKVQKGISFTAQMRPFPLVAPFVAPVLLYWIWLWLKAVLWLIGSVL